MGQRRNLQPGSPLSAGMHPWCPGYRFEIRQAGPSAGCLLQRSMKSFSGECRCQFLSLDKDRQAFLAYAMKVMLYQPQAMLHHQAPALPLGRTAPNSRMATGHHNGARVSPTSPCWPQHIIRSLRHGAGVQSQRSDEQLLNAQHWRAREVLCDLNLLGTPEKSLMPCWWCSQANGSTGGAHAASAPQGPVPEAAPPIPPGLCPADVKDLEGKSAPEGQWLLYL